MNDATSAYLLRHSGYLYCGNVPILFGISEALNLMTSVIISALATPWGRWWNAPSLWAIEWHTPKKALANAIPAIVDALAMFSLATGSLAPFS